MRIIRGNHRGRRIQAPAKLPVRPTTDLAKESLFNILENTYYFDELKVLDLFAGTGNISYEFASRGAKEIVAVDLNVKCTTFIHQTAEMLKMDKIKTIRANAFNFLKVKALKFDIIFADPPYDLEGVEKIPELVFQNGILDEDGIMIIEHSKNHDFSEHPNFSRQKKYGNVNFSFFENTKD